MTSRYSMDYNHMGEALVFSNKEFKHQQKQLAPRLTNDGDYARMRSVLEECGFHVHDTKDVTDLTGLQMKCKIEQVAKEDHTHHAALVLVFLTYGGDGIVYAHDVEVTLESLLQPLKGDQCTTLAGKPKIMILQTCPFEPLIASNAGPVIEVKTIPSEADFLYLWSSVPARLKWTDEHTGRDGVGSMFIGILYRVLKADKADLSLTKIMTKVTRKVAKQLAHGPEENWRWLEREEKLPLCITMLTKQLYLPDKQIGI